jgi:hypothetical protein
MRSSRRRGQPALSHTQRALLMSCLLPSYACSASVMMPRLPRRAPRAAQIGRGRRSCGDAAPAYGFAGLLASAASIASSSTGRWRAGATRSPAATRPPSPAPPSTAGSHPAFHLGPSITTVVRSRGVQWIGSSVLGPGAMSVVADPRPIALAAAPIGPGQPFADAPLRQGQGHLQQSPHFGHGEILQACFLLRR